MRDEGSTSNRKYTADNLGTVNVALNGTRDKKVKNNLICEAEWNLGIGTTEWGEELEQKGEEMDW